MLVLLVLLHDMHLLHLLLHVQVLLPHELLLHLRRQLPRLLSPPLPPSHPP